MGRIKVATASVQEILYAFILAEKPCNIIWDSLSYIKMIIYREHI